MITGKILIDKGWPEGPVIGKALRLAETLAAEGLPEDAVFAALEGVRANPDAVAKEDAAFDLGQALMALRVPEPTPVRAEPLHAPIWGEEIIDPQAIHQLHNAMRLPVTVGGALMPDAHVGYGIPIGGVVALENAVAPYMVGVDIACRMMMSIFPADSDVMIKNASKKDKVRKVMREETRFGLGAKFGQYERRQHAVLDDPDWEATRLLKHLKDKAYAQLGTSGTGNHFVDAGLLRVDGTGAGVLGIEPGVFFAIMTHSGSRGPGASIANHYSRLAMDQSTLPKQLRHLAWLSLDTEAGQEYWISMNLAGRFASACHHTIHRAIAKSLRLKPMLQVENHHNFCIAGDQIVPTPNGPVQMADLKPGDTVYAFDETRGLVPTEIIDSWCSGEKEIFEIQTSNRRIRCSAEHPILTIEVRLVPRENNPRRTKRVGCLVWKKAAELKKGDILVCAESYYDESLSIGRKKARLAGAFLGDGWIRQTNAHISGYSVGFAIGSAEEKHTERYKELVEDVLPEVRWGNNVPGAYGLSCSSREVYRAIQELRLGARSAEAAVPSYIFTATREEKLSFLAGYIDADGSVSANSRNAGRGTIASVSKSLAVGVREIAASCGLRVTPVHQENRRTNFGVCTVYQCTIAADSINLLDLWHEAKRANQRATKYGKPQGLQPSKIGYLNLPGGIFAQSVRSVKRTGETEVVYDLTVLNESHSFVCEGIVVHNCWVETWEGKEVYVHRKGATPAHEGVLGIIPGSQGHNSFIVRGLGSEAALNSASHGAGRVMSRKQAKQTIPKKQRDAWLKERGVELLGSGMDEAPQAYKDINAVLALQADLVEPIAVFQPRLVLMADDGKTEG